MHLADVIALRVQPCAGLLMALTDRCPLRCAHCSTDSTMDSAQHDPAPLRAMVGSFTTADHPELIFMSGGEPLLRPGLVAELATLAREAGTRSVVLSGMFFARDGAVPPAIRRAAAAVDHFSASVDPYHEREVDRAAVFAALRIVLALTPAASLHVTAPDDSYLDDLLPQVKRAFGVEVPVLVSRLRARGRAAAFTVDPPTTADAGPCEFATWPLLDSDGTVFACSRQSLARRHRPGHLVLGDAAHNGWPRLRARAMGDAVLRSVRAIGPVATAVRGGATPCAGWCETCVTLRPGSAELSGAAATVAGQLLARLRPRDLARRWGAGEYAELVELGWRACG